MSAPLPPFANRIDIGSLLQQRGMRIGVELGVRQGSFSSQMLGRWHNASRYILVDAWHDLSKLNAEAGRVHYAKERFSLTYRDTLAQRIHRGNCTQTFSEALRKGPRCGVSIEMCRNWTHVCVDNFADASFDFVYIDALHDYKGALKDITLWWPKLRAGGIMGGHDWVDMHHEYYGSSTVAAMEDPKPGNIDRVTRRKLENWRRNYDGSWEESGKLVRGAVKDFFECRLQVGQDDHLVAPTGGGNCAHRREVSITFSRREKPASWAVVK